VRWILIGLICVSVITGLLVAAVVASPNLNTCTQVGSKQPDVMAGTDRKDVLCALQANDYQSGSKQADRLFGDNGRDTMVGGPGADILKGSKGNDRLFAVDGKPHDVLNGQKGNDACFGDRGDVMKGCEHRFRGPSIRLANAMAAAFQGGLSLAEVLTGITSPPPVPPPLTVTVTQTMTQTITLPPCGNGPPDPPPFCGGG